MTPDIVTGWSRIPVPGDPAGMSAYTARPATGDHPVVLVGFEMFGVTAYVRSVADRLARLGHVAVVPDFYHRLSAEAVDLPATAAGRERGLELLQGVDRDGVRADVRAVVDHLAAARVSMLGLSVGGHIAWYAATQVPFEAVAVAYPGWLTEPAIPLSRPEPTLALTDRIAGFGTRLLVVTGADDHLVTAGPREQIAARLRETGVDHELVVYPDTPHGFLCDERDTFRPEAAADAWERIGRHLA